MSSVSRLFRGLATPIGRLSQHQASRFHQPVRTAVTSETGAFLGDPERAKMGFSGVTVTVSIGLLLGATISKNMASFLEENELFVPTDDDDDD